MKIQQMQKGHIETHSPIIKSESKCQKKTKKDEFLTGKNFYQKDDYKHINEIRTNKKVGNEIAREKSVERSRDKKHKRVSSIPKFDTSKKELKKSKTQKYLDAPESKNPKGKSINVLKNRCKSINQANSNVNLHMNFFQLPNGQIIDQSPIVINNENSDKNQRYSSKNCNLNNLIKKVPSSKNLAIDKIKRSPSRKSKQSVTKISKINKKSDDIENKIKVNSMYSNIENINGHETLKKLKIGKGGKKKIDYISTGVNELLSNKREDKSRSLSNSESKKSNSNKLKKKPIVKEYLDEECPSNERMFLKKELETKGLKGSKSCFLKTTVPVFSKFSNQPDNDNNEILNIEKIQSMAEQLYLKLNSKSSANLLKVDVEQIYNGLQNLKITLQENMKNKETVSKSKINLQLHKMLDKSTMKLKTDSLNETIKLQIDIGTQSSVSMSANNSKEVSKVINKTKLFIKTNFNFKFIKFETKVNSLSSEYSLRIQEKNSESPSEINAIVKLDFDNSVLFKKSLIDLECNDTSLKRPIHLDFQNKSNEKWVEPKKNIDLLVFDRNDSLTKDADQNNNVNYKIAKSIARKNLKSFQSQRKSNKNNKIIIPKTYTMFEIPNDSIVMNPLYSSLLMDDKPACSKTELKRPKSTSSKKKIDFININDLDFSKNQTNDLKKTNDSYLQTKNENIKTEISRLDLNVINNISIKEDDYDIVSRLSNARKNASVENFEENDEISPIKEINSKIITRNKFENCCVELTDQIEEEIYNRLMLDLLNDKIIINSLVKNNKNDYNSLITQSKNEIENSFELGFAIRTHFKAIGEYLNLLTDSLLNQKYINDSSIISELKCSNILLQKNHTKELIFSWQSLLNETIINIKRGDKIFEDVEVMIMVNLIERIQW